MRREFLTSWVLLGVWWVAAAAPGATPAGLVREGNEAFELGSFDEALKYYRRAEETQPDSAEIAFNQGAALYRKGNYSGAALRFEEAAQRAREPGLAAKAEYNLGNCRYREAEQVRERDVKRSIEATRQSVGHYRESLRRDPAHREAAENLEQARLQLKALLEEQQKQPQQQQEGGENQDGDQQGQQQQQQGGQGQEGQQHPEQQGQPGQGQDMEGQPGEQKPGGTEGEQAPGEKKEEAPENGSQAKGGEAQKDQQSGASGRKENQGEEPAEALDPAVREILDEEKENQARRGRVRFGVLPVEKDW